MSDDRMFCRMIYDSSYIPICRISSGGGIVYQFTSFSPESDPVRGSDGLAKRLGRALKRRPDIPYIEITEEYLLLGAVPCRDVSEGYYLVGPVPYLFSFSNQAIEGLAGKYQVYDRQAFCQTMRYALPRMTGRQFASVCCILQSHETGTFDYERTLSSFTIEEADDYRALHTLAQNKVYEPSGEVWSLPLSLARPLMNFILSGNGDAALQYLQDNHMSLQEYYPMLTKKDPYFCSDPEHADPMHYGVILVAAFASYIAQEVTNHGFDEETAWLLWWHYVELAMEARTAEQLNQCFRSVIYDFAQRSSQIDRDKEYLTQQSLAYIRRHVGEKISPSDVAADAGVSANYLNGIFKKDMGRSLHRQIQLEKISAAKTLLAYTDESILSISQVLQFNSQSYFTSVFKKMTGLTPQAYRDQFRRQ